MRSLLLLPLLACTSPPMDVQGPFTGTPHRFVVDRFDLPRKHVDVEATADDLDGDGDPDNAAGALFESLAANANTPPHPEDLIAEGMLASSVMISANDLGNDDRVGVAFAGSPDTSDTIAAGGTIVNGRFESNRARDATQPGQGTLVLAAMIDADPLVIPYRDGELELVPDGAGGYTGQLHATLAPDRAMLVAAQGLVQMGMSNPHDHQNFQVLFDSNEDSRLEVEEVEASPIFKPLLEPDVVMAGQPRLAIGFQFHLVPCETGTCVPTAVADSCHDRVRDGDETDVDCGGTACQACGFSATCVVGTDCQSQACDAGVCRDPSCTDHVQDGFETGVDQGGACHAE